MFKEMAERFVEIKVARYRDVEGTDPLPTQTYQEWLDESAEIIFSHHIFYFVRAAMEMAKYLWTRERLVIELLMKKRIIDEDEATEFFSDKAHNACERQGVKELTRTVVRAAASGNLKTDDGNAVDPDTVLMILNDIFDLNDTGWNGKTLEAIEDVFGGDKGRLRKFYEEEMKRVERINERRAEQREIEECQKQIEKTQKIARERRLKIYLSQCHINNQDPPSPEDQQKMLDGEIEIPRVF